MNAGLERSYAATFVPRDDEQEFHCSVTLGIEELVECCNDSRTLISQSSGAQSCLFNTCDIQ